MSAWNDFVKKIYHEKKRQNPSFQFKDALKEASRRKGEMGTPQQQQQGTTKKRRASSRRRKSRKHHH